MSRGAGVSHAELEMAARTDRGRARAENQDALGSWSDRRGRHLLVVADGLGGHRGGATASRLAIEAFGHVFARASREAPESLLRNAFTAANATIRDEAATAPDLEGMATTGIALLLELGGRTLRAWVAHVGDSRGYRLRAGSLEPLTIDHTLRAQLRRSRGLATRELDAIPGVDALLRALGPAREVEVEVREVPVEPGDRLLICSDGLFGPVPERETEAILTRYEVAAAAKALVDRANECGGPDNITLQIAVLPGPLSPTRASDVPEPPSRGVIYLLATAAFLGIVLISALVADRCGQTAAREPEPQSARTPIGALSPLPEPRESDSGLSPG